MFASGRRTGCKGSTRGRVRKWEIPTVGQVSNLSLRGAETGMLKPKQGREAEIAATRRRPGSELAAQGSGPAAHNTLG
jgi:hypothetical protein